jgi:long-subunit fatty acid transport protein
LNDKWTIWGDGAYLENQSIFNDYRADVFDNDFKTMSIGVGYKINDKFRKRESYTT